MSSPAALESTPDSRRTPLPKVSICIPAYQAERHLEATINSVLAQNYGDLEFVIIDNNSSDGTREILESVTEDRVRIIRNATTLPIVENWNLAVQQCRGKFVKVLCADDTLEPDCIAAQSKILEDNPSLALVAIQTDFIDDEGRLLRRARGLAGIVGRHSGNNVVREIVRSGSNPIGPPAAAMFRRVDFNQCGGFRRDFAFAMEMDLWVRLLGQGEFFGLARTLSSFRVSSSSLTASISMRSQLTEQIAFSKRLVDDPRWNISYADRAVGRVNCYLMQVRRTATYAASALRSAPRRHRAVFMVRDLIHLVSPR